MGLTLSNALTVALLLVLIGAFGVLRRRSLILVLLSVEIMLNGANMALIAFNYFLWGTSETGHYLYMLSIGVAAVEAAVGLAMVIVLFRNTRDVTRDRIALLGETDDSGMPGSAEGGA
jgi:NADH-quinone oxidoreductase subunit K